MKFPCVSLNYYFEPMNIIKVYLGLFLSRNSIFNILTQDDLLGLENIENRQFMTNFEWK